MKEVKKMAEENRHMCKRMEERYEKGTKVRMTKMEQEVERKVDEEKLTDLKEELKIERDK